MADKISELKSRDVYIFRVNIPRESNYKNVVLIDTHCFTTTVIDAISKGAKGVHALTDVQSVPKNVDIKGSEFSDGIRNNPKSLTREKVESKTIGIKSTNGAPAVHELRGVDDFNIYAASNTNATAVADEIPIQSDSTMIVLAGSRGSIPFEDVLTAELLYELSRQRDTELVIDMFKRIYDKYILSKFDTIGEPPYQDKYSEFAGKISQHNIVPVYESNFGFTSLEMASNPRN